MSDGRISSAHLVLVQHLLGFSEPLVFFDIVLHLGTLVGLVVYFAGDVAHLRGSFSRIGLKASSARFRRWGAGWNS